MYNAPLPIGAYHSNVLGNNYMSRT